MLLLSPRLRMVYLILWTLLTLFNIILLPLSATPVCVYDNRFYISDTEIYDRGCNVAYCDKMANLIYRNDCSSKTAPSLPTALPRNAKILRTIMSTVMTTPITTLYGCHVGGKFYSPGQEINRGEDKASNWCYGSYCSPDGQVAYWDNFNCFTTAFPTTVPTTLPTMLTTLLSRSGCYFNGRFYPPNTNLGAPDDRATKYCTKCDENGKIQHWYDYDCFRGQSTPPTSILPTADHNIVG